MRKPSSAPLLSVMIYRHSFIIRDLLIVQILQNYCVWVIARAFVFLRKLVMIKKKNYISVENFTIQKREERCVRNSAGKNVILRN